MKSDTPRTDEKIFTPSYYHISTKPEVVMSDFARQLERELNEAKKDSKRLDWLANHNFHPIMRNFTSGDITIRTAIDQAMKGEK